MAAVVMHRFSVLAAPSVRSQGTVLGGVFNMEVVQEFFGKYDGKKIELPEKFLPARQFIEFHNTNIFERLG